MSFQTDFHKVEKVINSCATKQHIIVAFKMVDFLASKFRTENYTPYFDEILRNELHKKALYLKRNSQPFNIAITEQ